MTPAEMQSVRVSVAQRFLQTALIIDDQAELTPADDSPKTASRVGGSVIAATEPQSSDVRPAAAQLLDAQAASAAQAAAVAGGVPEVEHSLNAKAITDAFLLKSIICGVFRPSADEDPTAICKGAAIHADIVIVDWFLEKNSSARAKSIIRALLTDDSQRKGRLRLIVVYTSNPGRAVMATELFGHLNEDPQIKGSLKISGGATLEGQSTRIVFVNKSGTIKSQDIDPLAENELPDRLVVEFAKLVDGLLPTFAVSAISVLREETPHILSLFSSGLDGAYVGHRCALPDPDDAEDFAVDLITGELRTVIEMHGIAQSLLGLEAVTAWIDGFGPDKTFSDHDTVLLPTEVVKRMAAEGASVFNEKTLQKKLASPQEASEKKIKPGTVTTVFYPDAGAAQIGNRRLARLSNFKNEGMSGMPTPAGWVPHLSLGSILKPLGEVDGAPKVAADFLLCLQPVCDSVRLDDKTAFPFQTAFLVDKKFNVVVKHNEQIGAEIRVGLKPRDTVMVTFDPDAVTKRVLATRDNEMSIFVFRDTENRQYHWVGDLKELKAQSIASQLGARIHGVGLDDLEWLRLSNA